MKPCFIDEIPEYKYTVTIGDWIFECQTLSAGAQAEIARTSRKMNSNLIGTDYVVNVEFLPEIAKLKTIEKALISWNAKRELNISNIELVPKQILEDLYIKIQEHENKIIEDLPDKEKN